MNASDFFFFYKAVGISTDSKHHQQGCFGELKEQEAIIT